MSIKVYRSHLNLTKTLKSLKIKIDQTWAGLALSESEQIKIEIDFQSEQRLSIQLQAPYHRNPPPNCPKGATWGLWQFEVVEVFLVWDQDRYLEIEMGPHGHHLILGLDGIRQIRQAFVPVVYQSQIEGDHWQALLLLDLGHQALKDSFVGQFKWQSMKSVNAFAIHQPLEKPLDRRYCVAFDVAKINEHPNFHCIDRFMQMREEDHP